MTRSARAAAKAIAEAEAVIITAGAGMGVDSGLPDFRGSAGFWSAYPMYERLGVSFINAANPGHFKRDPAFGWGFYGHRTHLYRETTPHEGFHILRRWIGARPCFVVTSNVDGQFQKAGYAEAEIFEVHGSIHHLQCAAPCADEIWLNEEEIPIDLETMRASRLPRCPRCGGISRPNILMFGDGEWIDDRAWAQQGRFVAFQERVSSSVIIELGAGTAIPTIRHLTEDLGARAGAAAIRINPREPEIYGRGHLSFASGALSALQEIDAAMGS